MKALTCLCVFIVLLAACSKRDLQKWKNRRGCDLAEQRFEYEPKPPGLGPHLVKGYDANGLPQFLNVLLTGVFGEYDSLECHFTYAANTIGVQVHSARYPDEQGQRTESDYSFNIALHPLKGYATKVGPHVLQYQNNRLVWFGPHKLEYDNRGNLVYIRRSAATNPGTHEGLQFRYDATVKSATDEFYFIPDLQFGVHFALAEIMGWIPTHSPYARTHHIINLGEDGLGGDYIADDRVITQHQYIDNKLVSFAWEGAEVNVFNTWYCAEEPTHN